VSNSWHEIKDWEFIKDVISDALMAILGLFSVIALVGVLSILFLLMIPFMTTSIVYNYFDR